MRLILCLSFCLSLLFGATTAFAATRDPHAPRQLMDQSLVTYPKSPGLYRLVGADYDAAHFGNGVGLEYTRTDVPGLQLDIYVYPRGRVEASKAVTDAMTEIEGEIRAIERQKTYTRLQFDKAVDFDVAAPPPAAKTTGRKRTLTMTVQGMPSQSLAYVFYRNLFLISVRATAPVAAVSSADFNAIVDRAVRDLVPIVDIRNFGTCGNINVSVDRNSDAAQATASNAPQMISEIARLNLEHCAGAPGSDDIKPSKGYAQKAIVYPAGTWH